MNIQKFKRIRISFTLVCVLFIALLFTNCDRSNRRNKTKDIEGISETAPDEQSPKDGPNERNAKIDHINFYFENSASINGYLRGKNFKQSIFKIIGNIDEDKLNTFFVNTKEYPAPNLLKSIKKRNIRVGNIGNSDHQFIFSNAISKATNNNLSIVVTDGIYSVNDGDIDIVEVEIENSFKRALKKNEIETVVVKLSSSYKGIYYPESCKGNKRIDQDRPYYIILFGNKEVINKAFEEVVILDDLLGFQDKARFMLTKNTQSAYTFLKQGEEKNGRFKATKRSSNLILDIKDVEKNSRSRRGESTHSNAFEVGVAIDFTDLALSDSYLMDIDNYEFEHSSGYEIAETKSVEDLDKNSKTYKLIKEINSKEHIHLSHILTLESVDNLYGDLEINLMNNLPGWIKNTGTPDDCNIKNDESRTFAFDQLILGISKAYEKVNNKNKYITINLKVRP